MRILHKSLENLTSRLLPVPVVLYLFKHSAGSVLCQKCEQQKENSIFTHLIDFGHVAGMKQNLKREIV